MSAPRLLAPTTISGGIPTAGAGTLNTVALWTPDGFTLGNSLLTQAGSVITNATGAIRANGTTQSTPAFMRYDATTSGIYFPATNEIGFTISSQHAMFISSGRLVGIGTTTPGAQLDVVGTTVVVRARASSTNTTPVLGAEPGMTLRNTNSTVGNYTSITNRDSNDNANGQINFINVNHTGSGAINFVTRDSVGGSGERVRIDSSGNVGIGTASPGYKLDVAGVINTTDQVRVFSSATSADVRLNAGFGGTVAGLGTVGAHPFMFFTNNTERARIDSSGNFGIGTASPLGYANFVALNIGDNNAAKTGLLKFRSTYNAGNGAELYQATDGRVILNADGTGTTAAILDPTNKLLNIAPASGWGLKLPATPGNADTQTLDCYQETTLNSGFTTSGITSTGTFTVTARATRIGRAIALTIRIAPSGGASLTFASGWNITLTGMPQMPIESALAATSSDATVGRNSVQVSQDATPILYGGTTGAYALGANVSLNVSGIIT